MKMFGNKLQKTFSEINCIFTAANNHNSNFAEKEISYE